MFEPLPELSIEKYNEQTLKIKDEFSRYYQTLRYMFPELQLHSNLKWQLYCAGPIFISWLRGVEGGDLERKQLLPLLEIEYRPLAYFSKRLKPGAKYHVYFAQLRDEINQVVKPTAFEGDCESDVSFDSPYFQCVFIMYVYLLLSENEYDSIKRSFAQILYYCAMEQLFVSERPDARRFFLDLLRKVESLHEQACAKWFSWLRRGRFADILRYLILCFSRPCIQETRV